MKDKPFQSSFECAFQDETCQNCFAIYDQADDKVFIDLVATVPLITSHDWNKTHNGNETDTHQNTKSSGIELGSDPINTGHGLSHGKHVFESSPENVKVSNFDAAYADWIK